MASSNKPRPLNSLLKEFMKRVPQREEMKRGMILHFWPEVVGEQVSRATNDLYFDKGRLIVNVESEVWRHELHARRFSIIKKLNSKVGGETVKEIVVRC